MNKSPSTRLTGLFLIACITLAACSQPSEPTPPPAPGGTPQITVEFNPPATPGPTPTPRPLGNPILVDRQPVPGEELQPDKPLVLVFDQAMDKASVDQAVSVTTVDGAAVPGKFEWKSDNIADFTPEQGWNRAARYNVALSTDAKSQRGLNLARPESFTVNTIGNLAVAQTIPANDAQNVSADSTITVLFNRPVVSLTTLAQQSALTVPVRFDPSIEGTGQWLNTSAYLFQPSKPLAAGTVYRGIVPARLTDTTGAVLESDYTWTFSVAAPVVKFVTPANDAQNVGLRQPISITFSQKMDHASTEAAFSIDPTVQGTFRWAGETETPPEPNTGPVPVEKMQGPTGPPPVPAYAGITSLGEVMAFVPGEDYQRGTSYTVVVKAGAEAAAGSGTTATDTRSTFQVIPLPAVVRTRPADGEGRADPTSGFAIRFSAPMSVPTIIPKLVFDPPLSLTNVYSYYDDFSNEFSINVDLKPSTAYRVRIGGDIEDRYGIKIGRPTDVRFTTGPLSPFVSFQTNGLVGTYNAAKPTELFAAYRNVTRMDFELVSLSPQEFYTYTGSTNSYEALRNFKPSESQLLRKWTAQTDASLNQTGFYKVQPDTNGGALTPGIYMLTVTAPEVLALDRDAQPVRHILVVSDLHITLKRGEHDGLVWVTNLNSSAPLPGLNVVFRDNNFNEIGAAQTEGGEQAGQAHSSSSGQAFVEFPPTYRPYNLLYAIAGEPGAPSFGIAWSEMSNGINPYDFNLPARYQAEPYYAYVYTDRPIYRPGQMVFYKGIVRTDDDARYTLPTLLSSVNLTVNNPQGLQVFSGTAQLSATGELTGEFALDNAATVGNYYIQICIPTQNPTPNDPPCSYFGVPFLVSAYRVPEFEVSVTTDKTDYLAGEMINATVNAKYFFGGSVPNAKVSWVLFGNDYIFDRYAGSGNYSFGDYDYTLFGPGFNQQLANGEGTTDASGNFVINVPADLSKFKGSARFSIEVGVVDPSDQSVSARADATVHKGSFYFGIAPESYVANAGEEVKADVISVDWQGKPIGNYKGTVTFNRRVWFTAQEEDQSGNRFYTSVPSDTEVSTVDFTTDADGKAVASFTPQDGGEYRMVVTGEGAGTAATSVYVSSSGEYVAWRVDNNDRIELKSDKTAYQVGETARVLVPSPFQGQTNALLTIERGDFIQRQTIVLTSNSDVLEIPIEDSFASNVYVSVLIVKGVDATNPVPAFKLGYTSFTVAPTQFELKIDIKTDKEAYAPRDTATYDIRVTDATGNPVQAELSLALVDKAVLSLTDPNSAPILDAFYGARALGVRTADTLSVNVDRITEKIAAAKGGGGGGEASAEAQFTRLNFKDTAYWNPIVNTDAEGKAQVQITLPDNLTTWVMTAVAITPDTKVGQATNEVLSTKALIVRPVTPRFFVVGDTVALGAVVNNQTEQAFDVDVSLVSTGLTLVSSNAVQKVNVPAKGNARVDWQVTVQDAPSAVITMTATGGGLQDSARPGLATAPGGGIPILQYAAPETVGTAGDVSEPGAKLELIALPPRLDTGQGNLTVRVDTALGGAAAKGVQALDEYPYESDDWVASRLITNLALAGVAPSSVVTDVAAQVSRSFQRLLSSQHSDGGWGWWVNDPSDPMVTANVVLALSKARDAGYPVDPNALTRAIDYLKNQLTPASDLPDVTAANRQAFILFALSEAGAGDSGRLGALYENRDKLSHYAKALLAMALDDVQKGDERIKTLLADIQSAAITSATGVSWQESVYDWSNFFSNTRSTAIILDALARLDPTNTLSPNVVRWLMAAREGDMWESTQETQWAITAFADWIQASGSDKSDFAWRVALNDQNILSGQANPNTLEGSTASVVVPVMQLLRDQANSLAFERGTGQGRMYYTAHLKAFLPADEAKAINRGIYIARKYESADCEPTPEKPCEAITSAKIGQNVRVRLTLVAPNDLYFVRVTDPLPGGAEVIDTSLRTSQSVQEGGAISPRSFFGEGWGWWYFGNTQVYDDRAAVFAQHLPAGTYEYTYVIRPSIAGQFKVMPASVEQTYFPETFGRSDGAMFAIER